MRLILIAEALNIGGLPNYVLMLARAFQNAGHTVLVAHGNTPLAEHLETHGLDFIFLPGLARGADDKKTNDALGDLRSWRPDIVHIHLCSHIGMLDRLLGSGLPLVRTFHDYTSLCLRLGRRRWPGDRCQRALAWSCAGFGCVVGPPPPGRRLPRFENLATRLKERDRYRLFGASVVPAEHMAATLCRNGFASSKIHIVPHFTRFEREAAAGEPPTKLPGTPGRDRPFRFIFSGQAIPSKGLEMLIEALQGLEGNWELHVRASGSRLQAAKDLAQTSGVASQVTFLGWVSPEEMRNDYRDADLLVLPSLWDEPFGLVGIDAMAYATPIVGFGVGGIPEYVRDNETGVLVRKTTAKALRAGLTRAMEDPERLAGWGRSAQRRVAALYTADAHVTALSQIYDATSRVRA